MYRQALEALRHFLSETKWPQQGDFVSSNAWSYLWMQVLVVTLNSYSASLTQFSHFELDFQRDFFCTYLDYSPSRRSRCSTSFPHHLALVWYGTPYFVFPALGSPWYSFFRILWTHSWDIKFFLDLSLSNFSPETIYISTRFPRIYLGVSAIYYYRDFSPNYLLYSGGGCLIWFFDREIYTLFRLRYWYTSLWLDCLVLQMHR